RTETGPLPCDDYRRNGSLYAVAYGKSDQHQHQSNYGESRRDRREKSLRSFFAHSYRAVHSREHTAYARRRSAGICRILSRASSDHKERASSICRVQHQLSRLSICFGDNNLLRTLLRSLSCVEDVASASCRGVEGRRSMIKHLVKLVWNRKRINFLITIEIFF